MKKLNLVVGAGFSGAVIAERLAVESEEKVIVIDKKDYLGGICREFSDKNGIPAGSYGAKIFHTNNEKVWRYLKQFCTFNTYMHRVKSVINGTQVSVPFNYNSLYEVFPLSFARRIEEKLFEKFEFNTKVSCSRLYKTCDKDLIFLAEFIGKHIKDFPYFYASRDNRVFSEKYQGIPVEGINAVIRDILNHPDIEISLGTDYKEVQNSKFDKIFYCGSIDEFFEYKHGILPYMSFSYKFEEHPVSLYQSAGEVRYPENYDFEKIYEFKYFTLLSQNLGANSTKTLISKEYSRKFEPGENERFLPVINSESINVYQKYLCEAKNLENIFFIGGCAEFKRYNICETILNALKLYERVEQKSAILIV